MTTSFTPDPAHPDSIDLRSDTVTHPTPEMRQAMAEAPLGDDVLGDDPSVEALERAAMERLGTEAAMFVPSGSMGNVISVLTLANPGEAAICEARAHCYNYEAGALSGVGGVVFVPVYGERGILDPDDVRARIFPDDLHKPWTRVLLLENTHNTAGGTCIPFERFKELCALAHEHNLKVHLDGARLWHASIATGIPEREYVKYVDTVSCCFSKGLSAPVGSIVASSAERIHVARKKRKMLGGGMRQSGILAAAALVAMETMVDRLADDHKRARDLAEFLDGLPPFKVNLQDVETNILMVDVSGLGVTVPEVVARLAEQRVRCLPINAQLIRLVTNRHFTDEKLERAKKAFQNVAA